MKNIAANEPYREAARMLKARSDQVLQGTALQHDILFGLNALLESGYDVSPGKMGILEDLKHKLEKVEGEHSPETVKELSNALQAFLDEEMAEEPKEPDTSDNTDGPGKEEGMGQKKEGGDAAAKAAADSYRKYADEGQLSLDESLEARKKAAKADKFGRYAEVEEAESQMESAEEETESISESAEEESQCEAKKEECCEACGAPMHKKDDKDKLPPVMEADHKEPDGDECDAEKESKESMAESMAMLRVQVEELKQNLTEVRSMDKGKFTEADRQELTELREYRNRRELRERATKELRKADLLDIYNAKELMEFSESQWPAIIKTWANAMPPQNYNVPRAVDESPAATKTPLAGEDYFRQFYAE